ncbi:MAG: hypothetical protein N2745_11780 [Syntrophorhabdaceae bacterium]|nr:hypothetical protein [Syntrophorhabdaceae bacterium]
METLFNVSIVFKNRKLLYALALCILPFLFVGCASIIKGSEQTLTIKSSPPEATIKIIDLRKGNEEIANGKTPFTITLPTGKGYFKSAKYLVKLEREGYMKKEVEIEGTVSGWYIAGNFIFGGLIGWLIVDPLTGAMWTFDVSEAGYTLEPLKPVSGGSQSLTIALITDIPEGLKGKMRPLNVDTQ